MDNISDNDDEVKKEIDRLEQLEESSKLFRNLVHFYRPKKGRGLKKRLRHFLKHLWFKYVNKKDGDYLRILDKHKSLVTKHNREVTHRVGEMIIPPLGRHVWMKEWLGNTEMMPFELIQIPVPAQYEECLNASYGIDWRTPKRCKNFHGEVFFDVDHPYTEYLINK